MDALEELKKAIWTFDEDTVKAAVEAAIKSNIDMDSIIECLSMETVRIAEKYDIGELALPHLVVAADIVRSIILEFPSGVKRGHLGKVIIGVVKGDSHNIGKNLVAAMLSASGFDVVDLGDDVPPEKFIQSVKEHNADILAMSTLMTITMPVMKEVVDLCKKSNIKVKIMVGGAPITKEWAMSIGADGYGKDCVEAVKVAKKLLGRE